MERALSPSPGLHLDAKRIAATSVAILVHAAVLMLLLMPTTARREVAVEEPESFLVPEIKKIEPIPLPKPPDPKPVATRVEKMPATPVLDPPVDPVSDPSPVDVYTPPRVELPPATFGGVAPTTVFAQIATDIAPTPPYPRQALLRRLAGEVVLRIRVDAQGRPIEVTIETSSGFSVLDEAAAKFVKARWHFVPATQDGRPVEALALLPVNFALPR